MKGIITICGSTKFKEQFEEVNRRLTWSDWVVLSVGSFHLSEKDHDIAGKIIARKVLLDILHKQKIAMSQAIVIINVDTYIGESTASEINYARSLGKHIYWYQQQPYYSLDRVHFNAVADRMWTEVLEETIEPKASEKEKVG